MKRHLLSISEGGRHLVASFQSMFSDWSRRQRILASGFTATIALGLLAAREARAFVLPVIDASSLVQLGHIWKQDISTYAKIVQEYKQLVSIYQTELQAYPMAVAMSQMVSHPQRLSMLALGPQFLNDMTESRYGEAGNWAGAMNGGQDIAKGAWNSSTVTLGANPYLALEKLGSSALLAKLATVEQIDGASVRCSQVISQYNGQQQQNVSAVQLLKAAGLDVTPTINAVVAQLNLQNAASQQARMEQQHQGNIQACLAEQQMLANKTQRDIEVENLNFLGQVKTLQSTNDTTWADGETAFFDFRLP